jgi:iron complex transport system ATP-binding protein
MNGESMLELININFNYGGRRVLDSLNFSISSDEFVAIIGPNGAGKSTLMKIIDGILPAPGQILLANKMITAYTRKQLARLIAYLPQDTEFTFAYTVDEVVRMGRYPHVKGIGYYSPTDEQVIDRVMSLLEVQDFRDRNFNELSGGERQRVLIASALAQEPKILLLDEPTAALDLHHQIAIYQILKTQQIRENLTVILVTHDINLAAQYCNRMVLLFQGKIISDGKPDEVLKFKVLQNTFGVKVYIDINPITNSIYILPYA